MDGYPDLASSVLPMMELTDLRFAWNKHPQPTNMVLRKSLTFAACSVSEPWAPSWACYPPVEAKERVRFDPVTCVVNDNFGRLGSCHGPF
jgi:hypothetical protein